MQKEILELHKLIKLKNIDKAYVEAKKLYKSGKKNQDIVKVLAYLHIQKGNFDSAINVLDDYYKENSAEKDFDYFINMGIALKSLEEFKSSLSMYEKATEINSNSPLCYTVPAEIYLKLRNFDKAIRLINIALEKIELASDKNFLHFPNAIKLKTEINVALNKDKESGKMLKKILDKKFHPDIFYLLAVSNLELIDDELLKKAENQLEINDMSFQNKLDRFWYVHPLYFGLAICYQKIDQSKSEEFYHLGNRETMKSLRYNSFVYQKTIGDIISHYKNSFLKANINSAGGANNIFILGTPRSGTTLIESIIGSSDDVTSGGELLSGFKLINEFVNNGNINTNDFIKDFKKKYLNRTDYLKGDFRFIIDKLPENFLFIGYLLKILPESKIIRTFRNPWDVAISLYKQRYVTNIPYSASFFNIGVFMSNFEAINIFWSEQFKLNERMLDIKYEDLVRNTEHYQKEIYKFLDIKSDFDENKRKAFFSQTASIRQIGGDVHTKSIEKSEFLEHKNEFYDALFMQRKYWEKRDIVYNSEDFFGYKLG